jgi:DNA-binding winged helix-turn-helix (wHTH) protein
MSSERVHLGQLVLDLGRYELTRAGKPVRVERIPMDLLILLVRESGRLVSREEIIERLWGKDVFFDTDNSINTAIRKIRRALGEDPEKPQYIETVLGKGYRFKGGTDAVTRMTSPQVEAERPRIMLAVLPSKI